MKYAFLGLIIIILSSSGYIIYKIDKLAASPKPSLLRDETVYIIDDDMDIPPGLGYLNVPDTCYAYFDVTDSRLHLIRNAKNVRK